VLAEVYRYILSPRIVFDRSNPVLVSNPAVLVAPKRRLGKGDQVFVDRDSADLEPRRHVVSQLQVVRPDTSIQTVVRFVGHRHNFVTHKTGPKISSQPIFISPVTSAKIVGSRKLPLSSRGSLGFLPPHSSFAPSATPSLT